jgi:GntR family transcriptional regulator of vanillate catabolism
MDVTAEPFQPARWFEAHLGFHVRIATCCGNSQLHTMLNLIRMTTLSLHGPLHDRAELGPDELGEILRVAQEQHYAIYDSIRGGDERSAEAHARRHIRATLHSNLIDQATGG